jgi:hypothetical protein
MFGEVNDLLLCIISTSTDSDFIKFVVYNLEVTHFQRAFNCRHVDSISCTISGSVYDLYYMRFGTS